LSKHEPIFHEAIQKDVNTIEQCLSNASPRK